MNFEERALSFSCHDSWLYGILSLPEKVISRGVLIVVGGPQYRVGSHRQFMLLARYLAAHGVPVMRFDCRGKGDSEGDAVWNFEFAREGYFSGCPNSGGRTAVSGGKPPPVYVACTPSCRPWCACNAL